jgi:hypothetical protein
MDLSHFCILNEKLQYPESGSGVGNFEKQIARSCFPHMKTPIKMFLVKFNGSIGFLHFEGETTVP